MKTKNLNIKLTEELQLKMQHHKKENCINWSGLITEFIEKIIEEEEQTALQIEIWRNEKK